MQTLSKEIAMVFKAIALAESGDFETARVILNEASLDHNKQTLRKNKNRESYNLRKGSAQ